MSKFLVAAGLVVALFALFELIPARSPEVVSAGLPGSAWDTSRGAVNRAHDRAQDASLSTLGAVAAAMVAVGAAFARKQRAGELHLGEGIAVAVGVVAPVLFLLYRIASALARG